MTRSSPPGLALLAAALLAGGCSSPLGGRDLELGVGPSALPGVGGMLSFTQRVFSNEEREIGVEVDWTQQRVDRDRQAGFRGSELDQVRLGVRGRWLAGALEDWHMRGGVVWLRTLGDPVYLDKPGDYGGGYLGFGYEFPLGEHLVTGPDLTVHLVDSEGSGDAGVVPQLAWRLYWKL